MNLFLTLWSLNSALCELNCPGCARGIFSVLNMASSPTGMFIVLDWVKCSMKVQTSDIQPFWDYRHPINTSVIHHKKKYKIQVNSKLFCQHCFHFKLLTYSVWNAANTYKQTENNCTFKTQFSQRIRWLKMYSLTKYDRINRNCLLSIMQHNRKQTMSVCSTENKRINQTCLSNKNVQ